MKGASAVRHTDIGWVIDGRSPAIYPWASPIVESGNCNVTPLGAGRFRCLDWFNQLAIGPGNPGIHDVLTSILGDCFPPKVKTKKLVTEG